MSRKEKVKTMIDLMKSVFSFIILSLFGTIGYLFINYETLNTVRIILIVLALIALLIAFITITLNLIKKLNELEEL